MAVTATKAPTLLSCPNGHKVEVQPWGTRPLTCPACVHGVPCQQPLTPVRNGR